MAGPFDNAKLLRLADWLAIGVAASLPWSTSATIILVALWALTLIAMFEVRALRDTLLTAAGGLPVLLFALGVIGMLWADVSWQERFEGVDSFLKLLAIPLLLVHFQRSERGLWVLAAFALSCVALLLASTIVMLVPPLAAKFFKPDFTIVKSAASQSGEFVLCIFCFLYLAADFIARRQWRWLAGIAVVSGGMLASMAIVATGRTALVTVPVLLVLFAWKRLTLKQTAAVFAGAAVLVAVMYASAPHLRDRTVQLWTDTESYVAADEKNSSGERIEFYVKSIRFIKDAPWIGHGTGSITALFAAVAAEGGGASATATTNPHNQTFAVAIQLGLLGAFVLWAMWSAHLLLFRAPGLVEWIGIVVVVQNIIGSMFNSHLFDFLQGWTYVFGFGVAGGMVLKRRLTRDKAAAP